MHRRSQDIEQKPNFDNNLGLYLCCISAEILTHNNSNLDLVNINAYAKFGLIPSISSQDTEWKQNQTDRQVQNSILPPPYFVCGRVGGREV